jgi:hypothetical protein
MTTSNIKLKPDLKTCTICGEEKPSIEYYFNEVNNSLYTKCKECHKKKVKLWRVANPDKVKTIQERYQQRMKEEGKA